MKPVELNRTLECDDGIFNIKWEIDRPKYKDIPCEWEVLGGGGNRDGRRGEFWCIECGMVLCKKHRAGHQDSRQHEIRMKMWKEKNG